MSAQPLAIDLCCGLGGWTEGLLAAGYYVVGFDIERHEYDGERYPAQLVLQDVLTLHGSQFKDAALIVASPPCQAYSYMAMPWTRGKELAAKIRADETGESLRKLNTLFDACFRIQREACQAAGHHIPMVVENVRGAQEWVGRSAWNYGSFHLLGDIPAIMPEARSFAKVPGFRFDGSGRSFQTESVKVSGMNWANYGGPGYKAVAFNDEAIRRQSGRKGTGSGAEWFDGNHCVAYSKSKARKAAAARIAKIPFDLSYHIARTFRPVDLPFHRMGAK